MKYIKTYEKIKFKKDDYVKEFVPVLGYIYYKIIDIKSYDMKHEYGSIPIRVYDLLNLKTNKISTMTQDINKLELASYNEVELLVNSNKYNL